MGQIFRVGSFSEGVQCRWEVTKFVSLRKMAKTLCPFPSNQFLAFPRRLGWKNDQIACSHHDSPEFYGTGVLIV